MFVGDHPGDELGIHPIGLAPQPNGLGIVAGILRIEQEHQKAELVGSLSEQLVIDTGGFHTDAAARRQTLEPGQHRRALRGPGGDQIPAPPGSYPLDLLRHKGNQRGSIEASTRSLRTK